jgi:hypothetical protein
MNWHVNLRRRHLPLKSKLFIWIIISNVQHYWWRWKRLWRRLGETRHWILTWKWTLFSLRISSQQTKKQHHKSLLLAARSNQWHQTSWWAQIPQSTSQRCVSLLWLKIKPITLFQGRFVYEFQQHFGAWAPGRVQQFEIIFSIARTDIRAGLNIMCLGSEDVSAERINSGDECILYIPACTTGV